MKWKPEFVKQAKKLARLGATDKELADFFEVNPDTVYEWKNTKAEFKAALETGKLMADANVAASLYRRAIGYKHKAVKIFFDKESLSCIEHKYIEHYPPDTMACMYWLNNRRGQDWKQKQITEIQTAKPIQLAYALETPPAGALPAVVIEATKVAS